MDQQATAAHHPNGPKALERLITTDEAAEILGVGPSFLNQDRLTKRHGIPYIRVGRSIKYRLDDLNAWIAAHRECGMAA